MLTGTKCGQSGPGWLLDDLLVAACDLNPEIAIERMEEWTNNKEKLVAPS